jgi:hypothetical protein
MYSNEGQGNRMIKDIEGLNRCNPKDVEYVDFGCRDSFWNLCVKQFTTQQ